MLDKPTYEELEQRVRELERTGFDRKQAEEQHLKSDERFRIAQEMSPDGFTILRPVRDDEGRAIDFTWIYENEAVARMNGTDPQKVVGQRLLDLFPGHRETQIFNAYKQVAETGKAKTFEESYVGETIKKKTWFRIVVVPMGEDIAILNHDITERRTAEKNLLSTFNISPSIIAKANLKTGFYIEANQAVTKILGYSVEEFTSKPIKEFIHPNYNKKTTEVISQQLEGNKVHHLENRFICKDGSYKWISWNATSADDDGIVIVIGSDINESKKAEEELKKIEWLLEKEYVDSPKIAKNYIPDYGDVTKLNTERTILDNVGVETLKTLCSDIMDLLDTSIAIYEKNGDYAFGQFDSTWCQTMDLASFRLCNTQDNKEALNCGNWLCHENCWNDSAKEAMKSQKATDIECIGGIHLYAVPIYAGNNLIGVINMGYGNPPTDERTLKELAEKYHVEYEVLIENATKYKSRPPFIIENAQKRLHTVAQLIGKIVDSAQKEKQIKKAKENAEKSEHLFRTMFSEAPLGIALINSLNGKIYEVNQKFAEIAGRTREEMATIDWMSITHPDDIQEDLDNMSLLNAGKIKGFNMQKRYIKPDDSYVWINMTIAPIVVEDKQEPRHLCMIEDITKQVLYENELIKAKEKVEESETSLREAQRIANIGNWKFDLQTGTVEMSDEMLNLTGLKDKNEALTVSNHEEYYTPESWCRFNKALETVLNTGKSYEIELEFSNKYAKYRNALAKGEAIYGENNNIIGLKGTLQDITKRKRDEKEKERLELQLRQAHKMEAVGTLAGGIAHDFNNILTSILGFTEISFDEVKKGSIIEENLLEVYAAGKRAKELVWQILTFARQSEDQLSPVQVDIIAKEVLKFIRSSIPTSIEIKDSINSDSLIMGNQTQIHQILMNLCTNASHAMESTGGIMHVILKDVAIGSNSELRKLGLKTGNYLELCVSDTGTGISSDIIDSIFDPYFTTKAQGEGTGMGLPMVQGIVENYGGKIVVKSKQGQGTTFITYIPVIKKHGIEPQREIEQLPEGTERILLIDDEAPIVKMGARSLESLGYNVTTRTSSLEALELFKSKQNAFDLVITDMTMPNMTGDTLAAELMAIRPEIPVILFTGYSKNLSEESVAEIGIKALVYKPIVKADLAKTIRKVLDGAKD